MVVKRKDILTTIPQEDWAKKFEINEGFPTVNTFKKVLE